jgi:hypothetical protein
VFVTMFVHMTCTRRSRPWQTHTHTHRVGMFLTMNKFFFAFCCFLWLSLELFLDRTRSPQTSLGHAAKNGNKEAHALEICGIRNAHRTHVLFFFYWIHCKKAKMLIQSHVEICVFAVDSMSMLRVTTKCVGPCKKPQPHFIVEDCLLC